MEYCLATLLLHNHIDIGTQRRIRRCAVVQLWCRVEYSQKGDYYFIS
jgi:hypothetical protein